LGKTQTGWNVLAFLDHKDFSLIWLDVLPAERGNLATTKRVEKEKLDNDIISELRLAEEGAPFDHETHELNE